MAKSLGLLLPLLGLALTGSTAAAAYNYTSFQPQLITCQAAQEPLTPTTLADLQSIVQDAIRSNQTIKAIGSLHSATDIICTRGIPVNMKGVNHFSYDPSTHRATVGAGMTLLDCLTKLHELGRGTLGIPTFGDVTIGGALGVGTHGSGKYADPGAPGDQVVGLVVVDGTGAVRNITDAATLSAFKANLGLLGLVYEAVIETVPQYKVEITHFPINHTILFENDSQAIKNYVEDTDRFQMWWFPTYESVVLSVGRNRPVETPGLCETHYMTEGSLQTARDFSEAIERIQEEKDEQGMFTLQGFSHLSLFTKVPQRSPMFADPDNENITCRTVPAVGFSHSMENNKCQVCPWEHGEDSAPTIEYSIAIPFDEMNGAFNTIQEIMQEYPVSFPLNGIYIRFIKASDGLMVVNSGRDTVVFEWVLAPRKDRYKDPMMGTAGSQAMSQAMISRHGGRPHWSKNGLYYSMEPVVRATYPGFPEFVRYMEEFDPQGVFLNEFGRRLRYGTNATAIDEWVEHCALVDSCLCLNDDGCGEMGRKDALTCGQLKGFQVCREGPEQHPRPSQTIHRPYHSLNEYITYLENM